MARSKDTNAKREQKQAVLVARTALLMNVSTELATTRLMTPLRQSVRLNPLIADTETTLAAMQQLGWKGRAVSWCEYGFTIDAGYEVLRDSDLVTRGAIYIQNQSSWLPVLTLEPRAGEVILDVCAAPGGKSSHIAALTQNKAQLVVNDNSRPRLAKLQANLTRLGVQAEYSLRDATRLSRHFAASSFDRILLDAPCSGEGLINLNEPKSLDSWSVAHVRRLAVLQKQLLLQAWQLLKPGGTLVYSTCTMAPEEDEAVIEQLLKRAPDAMLMPLSLPVEPAIATWNERFFSSQMTRAGRIFPLNGNEAFFVAKLQKTLAKTDDVRFI